MTFWKGKSAIVTGAGSGIGKALSVALAARGARVWLSDMDGRAAQQASDSIQADTYGLTLNVTNAEAVRAHIESVAEEHGRIDFIFNNAGIGVGGDFRELNLDHFERSIDVNIRGVVNGIMAAYPLMLKQGSGHIVSTASAAGLLGLPLMTPYAMTKHAVVGLTNALRLEAAEHNVRVSALCPMAIETPILDTTISQELGANWRPDIRTYLTKIGGAPYPVEKFVDYSLTQIEKNKGIIVAPLGGRIRLVIERFFPGVVERVIRKAFLKTLADRPN